ENSVYRCVEIAENLLQTSNVEAVIVASVDLAGSLENISLRQRYGRVSETATNRPNLLDSQQWLVGEGAGAFVVKPVSTANPNKVYATIDACSFAVGSDHQAIETAAGKACEIAGLKTEQINNIEAFASGFINDNQAEKIAFNRLYPDTKIDSVKRQVGHLFNASGMASIIKTALQLNKDKAGINTAINGLGKDLCCAHLILSSTNNTHQNTPLSKSEKQLSLVKTITLGGAHIQESIVKQSNNPLFATIKEQIGVRQLPVISNPVCMSLLQIKPTLMAQDATVISATATTKQPIFEIPTLSDPAGVKVNSKTSKEIFQQTKTHQAFIRSRHAAQQQIAKLITLQAQLASGLPVADQVKSNPQIKPQQKQQAQKLQVEKTTQPANVLPLSMHSAGFQIQGAAGYAYPPLQLIERYNKPQKIVFDSADLVEFAEGRIANVFGSDYKMIDNYARRVRLPTTDYLLVTRVTDLDAGINEYKKSYMATEYDIPTDAPFLIDGQIPWSVSVESGQCDLMLISYIGIDFQNKGERVYRLLDCELTFLEEMAFGGETLRYEIYIDSYAKNGEQLLFFFHYDCFVGDKKVLIMRNGCAGFFTDEELAEGKGVIHNDKDKAQFAAAKKSHFQPLIANSRTQYGYNDMMKLVNGDIMGCFGAQYDQQGRNPSLKFSSQKFL
ncbi:MAG: 3-hydroxyacyl-[acyl-carrier-protein] dehydratase FabA, partial [Psychromonas sp.]